MQTGTAAQRTFSQVLDGFPHAPVKRSGVSWTLKGQAALPVLHLPVVKGGICYGVHEVLPQRTVQNHLYTLHTISQVLAKFSAKLALTQLSVFYLLVSQPLSTNEELGKAGGWDGC